MATLAVEGAEVVVRLSPLEKLGALRGDVRVPLSSVQSVTVETNPWGMVRGVRAPGSWLPGVIALGVRRYLGGRDFTAIYRGRPVVRIELDDNSPFARLLIRVADPEDAMVLIQPAAG